MSSEFSSSSADQDAYGESVKALFSSQAYLSNSGPILDQWNISLAADDDGEYLKREAEAIGSQANLFLSGQQVRVVAFVVALDRRLNNLVYQYEKLYKNEQNKQPHEQIVAIEAVDVQLRQTIKYLHIVQANNAIIFYTNVYPNADEKLYKTLAKAAIYCIDLETLWHLLLTPKMFREEQANYLYKANFCAQPPTYIREAKTLMNKQTKIKKLLGNWSDDQVISKQELYCQLNGLFKCNLKEGVEFKVAAIIKGRFYTQQPAKGLKQEFIRQSICMYYREGAQEPWDYQLYQKLCLNICHQVIKNPKQFIDCFLFMEPENISFEDRKLIAQFAKIFNLCLDQILKLQNHDCQETLQLPIEFLEHILDQHNCQLFLHLLINFQSSNKNVYSINDPNLHSLFLDLLSKLKKLYLSMADSVCPISTTMFTSVTNRFFSKCSEDLSNDLMKILPSMVENMAINEFPKKVCINNRKMERRQMSKLEYLSIIFYYSEDVKQKKQDIYVSLPDFYPVDFASALLFLQSLKLKLKHHQPNEQQKQNYINILQQCAAFYKIKPEFNWFKKKTFKNDHKERQLQFQLHQKICKPWGQQVLQKILNTRDQQNCQDLRNRFQNYQIGLFDNVIAYWKYAVGLNTTIINEFNIQQQQLFTLLELMRSLLLEDLGDFSNMSLSDRVKLNNLHICLGFYNTKIQEAKGSQVYLMIIYKIIKPWVNLRYHQGGQKFKQQFKYFFSDFILKDLYDIVGDTVIEYLSQNQPVQQLDKKDVKGKLELFHKCLYKQSLKTMEEQKNMQILIRLFSIVNEDIDVDIIMQFLDISLIFLEAQPSLQESADIQFLLSLMTNTDSRFKLCLSETQSRQGSKARIIIQSLLKQMSTYYNRLSLNTIKNLLKICYTMFSQSNHIANLVYAQFSNIVSADYGEDNINYHFVPIFKALTAQTYLLTQDPKSQEIQQKLSNEWKQLEQDITLSKCNLRKLNFANQTSDIQKLNIYDFLDVFPDKLKEDINENIKKLKANAEKIENHEMQKKYYHILVWRKLIQSCGTIEDLVQTGQDVAYFLKDNPNNPHSYLKRIITDKFINNTAFKKIVNKMPALKECAEEIIKQTKNSNSIQINSHIIFKLILINSKFNSDVIESFILQNIQNIDRSMPIKIYQDYLVKSVKKQLQTIDDGFLRRIFIQSIGNQKEIDKIGELFQKIQCIPLKKFEKVKLLKELDVNIDEENEDWETESNASESSHNSEEKKKEKGGKNKQKIKCDVDSEQDSDLNREQQDFAQIMRRDQNEDVQKIEQIKDNFSEEQENQFSDDDEDMYDIERPAFLDIFYENGYEEAQKLYKEIMKIREHINILVDDDYRPAHFTKVYEKNKTEMDNYVNKMNECLIKLAMQDLSKAIIKKLPSVLRVILKEKGCKIQINEQQIANERKAQVKQPKFDNENNEDDENESIYDEEDGEDDDDSDDSIISLSEESDDSDQIEDNGSKIDSSLIDTQQMAINEDLCAEQIVALQLPDLQQVNSKIECELNGNQLSGPEICKILEMAMLYLFTLSPSELKFNKSAYSFYKEIFRSRDLFKLFNNSFIMLLRITQSKYHHELHKKLLDLGLSFRKALLSYCQMLMDFSNQADIDDSMDYIFRIFGSAESPGYMLPITNDIILHYNLPIQDNKLSVLILYSNWKGSPVNSLANFISKALTTGSKGEISNNYLSANRGKTLTNHIFNNINTSNFWVQIQERFQIDISNEVILKNCIPTFRQRLLEELKKILQNKIKMGQEKQQMTESVEIPYGYEEKVAQHNLKSLQKQIKHYYFWSRRVFNEMKQTKYSTSKLKKIISKVANQDKCLIQLTQLMMFYLKSLKDRFAVRSQQKTLKKLLSLPKSIVQISFIHLEMMDGWIDEWKSLANIKQFFQNCHFGQFSFTHLGQPCNLILQFLDIQAFCTAKMKYAIIPKLIKNQKKHDRCKNNVMQTDQIRNNLKKISYDLPLIFKLPNIPEDPEGQSIFVTRQCSFDMSFYQLTSKAMLVQFHEEEGSDHGGMVRQLMMGWKGQGVGEQYFFIGKLLGISFVRGIPYGGKFDYSMAIALTNYEPTVQLFKQVDKSIYDSLNYIKECTDEEELEDLSQRFVILHEKYGVIKEYPLKQNGQNIQLTLQNKHEYIDLYVRKYFEVGREWELQQLKIGFYSIVNKFYASIFHPFQLIQKIRGEEIDDYLKLKKKAKYEEGYTENSDIIKWLWQIISQFDQNQMNQFIQFLTGSPKVSIYDPNFTFVVEKTYGEDLERLPVAHTCFNTLDLPEYKTKQTLEKKLRQAIFQGNGNFGIL